jgi:hypothetical protein
MIHTSIVRLMGGAFAALGAAGLMALGGKAMSAPDKSAVQVPGGLAFAEFRGYEDWQLVAVSQSEETFAAILANPATIKAYRSGAPGNGKPFPDGAKLPRSTGS